MIAIDPSSRPRRASPRYGKKTGAIAAKASVLLSVALGLSLLAWKAAFAGDFDKAVETTVKKNRDSAKSQQRIDKLHDDTTHLAAEYREILEQHETLEVYNRQVETLIAAQEKEMESLERQIGDVTNIGRELLPLMQRMIAWLDDFVAADVPFLLEERSKRISGLREMMDRADVSDSEKYRRVLEAYQVETAYGDSSEAYKGTLVIDGQERTVNFLRVGRVVLVYQTLDRDEVGVWRQSGGERGWVKLPRQYSRAIQEGFRIVLKQAAPDLMWLPVPAPQPASAGVQP